MAQEQLKRKFNTFDMQLQEDLQVRVRKDRKEGVTVTVNNGNKRIKLGLTAWEELMHNRDQINLAVDFVRGLVGTDWSEFWHQQVEPQYRKQASCTLVNPGQEEKNQEPEESKRDD